MQGLSPGPALLSDKPIEDTPQQAQVLNCVTLSAHDETLHKSSRKHVALYRASIAQGKTDGIPLLSKCLEHAKTNVSLAGVLNAKPVNWTIFPLPWPWIKENRCWCLDNEAWCEIHTFICPWLQDQLQEILHSAPLPFRRPLVCLYQTFTCSLTSPAFFKNAYPSSSFCSQK